MYIPRITSLMVPKPELAKEDIPCFKVVRRDKVGDLYSVVLDFPYELHNVYTNESLETPTEGNIYFTVSKGFHSYASDKAVYEHYNRYYNNKNFEKVQCHIPKGSLYYVGEDYYGYPQYVSQSIVLDKMIL